MVAVSEQFERVAAAVAERAAEILYAPVAVVDERGVVIAGGGPGAVGRPLDLAGEPGQACLRVPMHVDGRAGEVLVAEQANGEAVSPRLAQVLVELMINQATVVARLPNQQEWKHKFIHDLLHGAGRDEADILREGQILGMDLKRPRAVILIDAAGYILPAGHAAWSEENEARVRRRAQLVIASVVGFFSLPDDTICAYIGDGEIAVLKAISTQDLAAWTDHENGTGPANPSWANLTALKRAGAALLARLQRDTSTAVTIGIGRYHPGVRGLARSYQDARAALSLGRRFQGRNQVHCLDGLGIAAFVGVADEHTKIDLATYLLSPLDQERELLETLTVFFAENCCPSAAAGRLAIHRNTLSYRLDKIASLTGLDPRCFDDAVQIRLALLLRAFREDAA